MILIDGRQADSISATDRGLHFGDGVFETIAVEDGHALCLSRHLNRLVHGCERLGIRAPETATLEDECSRLGSGAERAVLKIIVTRGAGGRGYAAAAEQRTTRIVSRHGWPEYPADRRSEGIAVRICETRLGRNRRLAGIKHLNRLEQVLARAEPGDGDYPEGLMLDDAGHVIEGIMSNVFARRGGVLKTPDLSECGVAGIIRDVVLETAREFPKTRVEITELGVEDLMSADECFLTNSLIGIWPIQSLQGNALGVGPLAREMQAKLIEQGSITRD